MTPAERVVEAARKWRSADLRGDIYSEGDDYETPETVARDALAAAVDALDAEPPAPRVTAGGSAKLREHLALALAYIKAVARDTDGIADYYWDEYEAAREALRRLETEPTA